MLCLKFGLIVCVVILWYWVNLVMVFFFSLKWWKLLEKYSMLFGVSCVIVVCSSFSCLCCILKLLVCVELEKVGGL